MHYHFWNQPEFWLVPKQKEKCQQNHPQIFPSVWHETEICFSARGTQKNRLLILVVSIVIRLYSNFPIDLEATFKPVVLNLGSVSQFQGFGNKRFWAMKIKYKKFITHILFFQTRRVPWMHVWNLWGSVPTTRLRTTGT